MTTSPHERASRAELTPQVMGDFAPDYGDCFRIAALPGHDAEEWAASSLRGAARANGAFSRLVWQGLLGFDLARPGTPGTMVGGHIRLDTPDRFEVGTDGTLMAGRMVFLIDRHEVTWATMLRFHTPAGRLIWAGAGHAHRTLAPRCLQTARRHLGPRPQRTDPTG